jgi:thiosulfate/3-mercaptopyruvate sulfurtransferase
MGISDDTLVVAYDSAGSLYATRFWWVLNYYGHTNVVVLNGGWRKWFDEARPATLERPRPAVGSITPRENPDLVCSLDYGIDRVGKADTVFLDVRSDGEWDGTNNRGNKRAGHVPGSVHLEWLNFVTDDTYRTIKPAHELRALLEERGVTADKQVITY